MGNAQQNLKKSEKEREMTLRRREEEDERIWIRKNLISQ
jgi:hypothetical protein